ncbi:MAG: TonB-dependent receptor, partial [Acidobacteriota bacterium]
RPAFNSDFISKNHQLAFNWTHIFSPTMVNESRVGVTRNIGDIFAGLPGVPRVTDAGSLTEQFGAYNGYPQIFHENIFTYADTLSITKGNHGFKLGAELRRNQENSEFNVGRPSYYFFDLVALGLDDPYYQIGGVNPNFDQGPGNGELASNFRGWRSWELGLFINDDWKLKPNLTLNIGLRWDWYSRLTEVQGRATAFDFSNGTDLFSSVRNGQFIGPVDSLSSNDMNNFGPRLGFAWDPFSNGKMSIRGGYGIAYQSGIFNPLANSRWNKPFYSFNLICDVCGRPGEVILYGPQDGSAPSATGANNNPGGGLFEGNIIAYEPTNPNLAFLSGIPNPDMRDPYTQSFFLGIQRELMRNTMFEVNYVGTLGRKLIRAENPNRFPGDRIGAPSPVNGEFAGDTAFNRINPNEGVLRVWENNVNTNYHSLQVQLNRRYSNGFAFNANYTWAKALDIRSTWHSGATSANRGQEGYSSDINAVFLDYGRAIFDASQRFVVNWLYETPWLRNSGNWAARNLFGGWQINSIIAYQTGQPFTPHCSVSFPGGCDYNADGNNTDRPNDTFGNSLDFDRLDFVTGVFSGRTFGTPTAGTNGTLGRNTFEGPGFVNWDFSIFKEVGLPKLGEEGKLQLRFEFFNLFNRPNFFQPEPRTNSSIFGQSTQSFDAREIQIGLKILF